MTPKKKRVIKAWGYFEKGKLQRCEGSIASAYCIHDCKLSEKFVPITITIGRER